MNLQVIHNNNLLPESHPNISANNRAFHYGDSLFESIRVCRGKAMFLPTHIFRLKEGMKLLQYDDNDSLSAQNIEQQIQRLLTVNNIERGGRMRLTVYRNTGGFYNPEKSSCSYLLQANPIEFSEYTLNDNGLIIDIYPEMYKQKDALSNFKVGNGLLYIMTSLYANDKKLDDCIIQDAKMGLLETSNSNLFVVSNGVLYTPSLDSGCLGGIMRMQIINIALQNGIQVYETNISPQNLLVADEVFLTNAINGIKWVGGYRTKRYGKEMSKKLIGLLNSQIV
jgi:branched-chain amino acid aminotransferase